MKRRKIDDVSRRVKGNETKEKKREGKERKGDERTSLKPKYIPYHGIEKVM